MLPLSHLNSSVRRLKNVQANNFNYPFFFSALLLGLLWWDTNTERQIEGQTDTETQTELFTNASSAKRTATQTEITAQAKPSIRVFIFALYTTPLYTPYLYYIYEYIICIVVLLLCALPCAFLLLALCGFFLCLLGLHNFLKRGNIWPFKVQPKKR